MKWIKFFEDFKNNNEAIAEARKFELSDDQYAEFIQWIQNSKFTYSNPLNNNLKELQSKSDELDNNQAAEEIIEKMHDKLNGSLSEMLTTYKEEIIGLMEVEIASRYYMDAGSIEAGLGDDLAIDKSLEVLRSPDMIKELLSTNQ